MSSLAEMVREVVASHPEGVEAQDVARQLRVEEVRVGDAIHALRVDGELIGVGGVWFTPANWAERVDQWLEALSQLHAHNPSAPLQPASRAIDLGGKPLARAVDLLERSGLVRRRGLEIALTGFRPQIAPKQRALIDRVAEMLAKVSPRFVPPHRVSAELGLPVQAVEKAIELGLDTGDFMLLGDRVVWARAETVLMMTAAMQLPDRFTLGEFRELTGLNRKDATIHLDHWDERGVTNRREDDSRSFSEQFQQRLRDIRLAHDDAADGAVSLGEQSGGESVAVVADKAGDPTID